MIKTTHFLLGASLLLTGTVFAQREHHCSRVKAEDPSYSRSARLSDHYIELTEKYDVHFYKLDINLERTSTDISGSTEIHVTVRDEALDTMLFELYDEFWIEDILMNGVTPISFSREESAVIVPVDYEAGDQFFITVLYDGTPPDGGGPFGGGGMTNDSSPSWGNQVTWSLSEPFAAYEWFAVKQSLTDKADSSEVHVTTDAENMAGSNGLLKNVVDVDGGKKRYEWKSNYPIDYYLISVAVAKYVDYTIYANPEGAPEPIMIQNFIYDNPATLPTFMDDIDETADYLEHFSELFGLYPFHEEKYGHCMAPIGGGMEHQTMTTQGYFVNWLTAHELGHQWFGDNVTCASWADIWINEGFASYSEELMLEEFYPGQEAISMQNRHNNIMSVDWGSVWVEDSTDVGRIFSGRLTYDKGAAIVHTMRFMVNNDELFFQTLKDFQTIYKDSTARGDDFKLVLEDVTGMDFTAFFDEWYYGEGFPTYSIEYTQIEDEVVVYLEQGGSMWAITPYFTNDLEIGVTVSGGETEYVRLTDIDDVFSIHSFPVEGDVVALSIDPNNWIINRNGGIEENPDIASIATLQNKLEIYPNPVKNVLTVVGAEEGTYVIYDQVGKQVASGILKEGNTQIQTGHLASGAYVISTDGSKTTFTKK